MFVAREPFKNGGTNPIKLRTQYESVRVVNTSDADDVTIELSPYFTYTLSPGEVFDEQVDPFDSIKYSGSGTFKGFVREMV